jgi:hypothetical protein
MIGPGLSAENTAAKASVNISGLTVEIPVSINRGVKFDSVIDWRKACFMISGRTNIVRFLPVWLLSQEVIPISERTLNLR